MKIEITKHLLNRVNRRKHDIEDVELTIELIEKAVKQPDFIVEDRTPNREGRILKINGRCLKVVVEKENDKLIVITVFWDRTLKRKGLCK